MDDSDLCLSLMQQSITFNVTAFEEVKQPMMQPQPKVNFVQPVVEEVIDTSSKVAQQEETKVGKKPKKNGGNKGLNRKALKNLIQQELQSQSKDIFREILKSPIEGVD